MPVTDINTIFWCRNYNDKVYQDKKKFSYHKIHHLVREIKWIMNNYPMIQITVYCTYIRKVLQKQTTQTYNILLLHINIS